MKKGFKYLAGLMVAVWLGACVPAMAQTVPNWASPKNVSLLGEGVRALYVTNLVSVTNQAYPGLSGTNVAGTAYTNAAGVRVVTTGSSGTNTPLLGSFSFWGPQHGGAWPTGQTNAAAAVNWYSPVTLSLTYDSGSGANSALAVQLTPVWDGKNPDTTGANDFIYTFTTTASASRLTVSTNLPVWLWNGAKSVMCKRVTYADTDASSQVIIRDLRVNGYGSP